LKAPGADQAPLDRIDEVLDGKLIIGRVIDAMRMTLTCITQAQQQTPAK
jgi:hypothetical protein